MEPDTVQKENKERDNFIFPFREKKVKEKLLT